MTSIRIILSQVSVTRQNQALLQGISCDSPAGENLLVTGSSGSGKTLLLQALAGKLFYGGTIEYYSDAAGIRPGTVLVEQHDYFRNKSHTGQFYYQQRFNSMDAEDSATVWQTLEKQASYEPAAAAALLASFGMEALKNASLLQLSSGEHKRYQLIKALLAKPELLLLDQPYLGLDAGSRLYLNEVLEHYTRQGGTVVMVASPKEAPACIRRVLQLENGRCIFFGQKEHSTEWTARSFYNLPGLVQDVVPAFTEAVVMKNVSIRYGEKTILDGISWEVKSGSKWLLKGGNGAGKSTLISLINGDNPQAFAHELYLFGRKKGSGESIWDIKKQIGYISPELQWHFDTATTCRQAVGSGFFDTIGLFRRLGTQQEAAVEQWLQLFGLEAFARQPLKTLPISKQKLVLLARAMVKNPPMLILDEPCQGLDDVQKEQFLQIVEALCTPSRTLIYVSHYPDEVPACIEQVLELKAGKATIYRQRTQQRAHPAAVTETL